MVKFKIFKGEARLVEKMINQWLESISDKVFNVISFQQTNDNKDILISIFYEIDEEYDFNEQDMKYNV